MTVDLRPRRDHIPMLGTFVVFCIIAACRLDPEPPVRAYAEGTLTIRAQEDSTLDYSGFEVLLVRQEDGDVDTLGIAETAVNGTFSMNIVSREAGVFPLIISRAGVTLAVEEFVVVDGDSTHVSGAFPLGGRRMRIVSPENAAWTAYRNAKYQHNETLLGFIQNQEASIENMSQVVERTSSVLWSLRTTFPRAMAADLAAVESIVMLEGWKDSTVVSRLPQLEVDNPTITGAVRAARRSVSRTAGLDSALALVRYYQALMPTENQRAELQAELVVAYTDSLRHDEALTEALELRRVYPESEWSEWAASAIYELENLLPGMIAPGFSVVSVDGETLSTEGLRGKFLILEFFEPLNDIFLKEYGERNAVFSSLDTNAFEMLSISLEPDSVVNTALFEEGVPPGKFAFAVGGRDSDIANMYNVRIIPTRFLIDPDGVILAKYTGSGLITLENDIEEMYRAMPDALQE